jgi:hypothetical protein
MLNLKGVWRYSKPKHTIANKGSMKPLQRFIQIKMKEHNHGERFFFFLNASDMDTCNELNTCKELNMLCI